MSQVLLHWLPRCRFTVSYSFSKSEPRYHTSDTWSYSFSLRPEITLIITDWHSFHFDFVFRTSTWKHKFFHTSDLPTSTEDPTWQYSKPVTWHYTHSFLHSSPSLCTWHYWLEVSDLTHVQTDLCFSRIHPKSRIASCLECLLSARNGSKKSQQVEKSCAGWAVEWIIYAIATCKITVVESWSSHSVIDPICGA